MRIKKVPKSHPPWILHWSLRGAVADPGEGGGGGGVNPLQGGFACHVACQIPTDLPFREPYPPPRRIRRSLNSYLQTERKGNRQFS